MTRLALSLLLANASNLPRELRYGASAGGGTDNPSFSSVTITAAPGIFQGSGCTTYPGGGTVCGDNLGGVSISGITPTGVTASGKILPAGLSQFGTNMNTGNLSWNVQEGGIIFYNPMAPPNTSFQIWRNTDNDDGDAGPITDLLEFNTINDDGSAVVTQCSLHGGGRKVLDSYGFSCLDQMGAPGFVANSPNLYGDFFQFDYTGGAFNQKVWQWTQTGNSLNLAAYSDDMSSATNVFNVIRTGTTPAGFQVYAPFTADAGATITGGTTTDILVVADGGLTCEPMPGVAGYTACFPSGYAAPSTSNYLVAINNATGEVSFNAASGASVDIGSDGVIAATFNSNGANLPFADAGNVNVNGALDVDGGVQAARLTVTQTATLAAVAGSGSAPTCSSNTGLANNGWDGGCTIQPGSTNLAGSVSMAGVAVNNHVATSGCSGSLFWYIVPSATLPAGTVCVLSPTNAAGQAYSTFGTEGSFTLFYDGGAGIIEAISTGTYCGPELQGQPANFSYVCL